MIKKFTLEEHIELAEFIRSTYNKFQMLHIDLSYRYGKTSKVSKKVRTVLDKLDGAKSELDNAYHIVATNEDFAKYGHVYYSKK
jgi:hypothetical protein